MILFNYSGLKSFSYILGNGLFIKERVVLWEIFHLLKTFLIVPVIYDTQFLLQSFVLLEFSLLVLIGSFKGA
jgi:hypothetical protein